MVNPKCGRPLGLRLVKETNTLYVADAFYGIFKVDILTGIYDLLFTGLYPSISVNRSVKRLFKKQI